MIMETLRRAEIYGHVSMRHLRKVCRRIDQIGEFDRGSLCDIA
jgi:hypothetical protein